MSRTTKKSPANPQTDTCLQRILVVGTCNLVQNKLSFYASNCLKLGFSAPSQRLSQDLVFSPHRSPSNSPTGFSRLLPLVPPWFAARLRP